ncbi:MAG TPA: hypothetical protein VHE54_09660 [Puia sp.]|nr:hypothetical protein [Puia sp.]
MSRLFLISLLFFLPPSGKDIVQRMYYRYGGKWYRTFTFNQTTDIYRNDSLRASQTWYEFIRFPDRFRMDFGDADSGNAAIFRGDSCYRFRNGRLRSTTINNNEGLIFLLGGMYFYPLDRTLKILSDSLHFNLNRMHEDSWENRPVYVIGADKGDTITNQLWVDQEKMFVVRMIRSSIGQTMDARFGGYRAFGMGWSETNCTFYINGKLAQVETYHNCRADVDLDNRIFDPSKLVHSH